MPAHSRFLRYFLAVARHGSIRRAAEDLRIAASAVDRQILLAEESFGAPLFERLPGGLRLTAAGEILLHRARAWTKELATVRAEIDELRGLRRGEVAIAVIEALSLGVLPRLLGRIRAEHPGIELRLRVLNNRDIPAAIAAHAVDFGLALNPPPAREVAARFVLEFGLGFVLPPDHPMAGLREARPGLGAELPLILPAEPLELCGHLTRIEALSGVAFRRVATADNIQMIKSLVQVGIGIGVLSAIDVHQEVQQGKLAFVPIEEPRAKQLALALCTAPARQISRAAGLVMRSIELGLLDLAGDARMFPGHGV